jgi:hypothetical protein
LSTEPCLIKVVDTAPSNNIRANEIAIETARTGKVIAVVIVMNNFCKKNAICGALILGIKSFLAGRQKVPIS